MTHHATIGINAIFFPFSATYRQPETTNGGYGYSTPYAPTQGLASPTGASKELTATMTPSIQDMDAERSIRRARRNRTCFTKHQVGLRWDNVHVVLVEIYK